MTLSNINTRSLIIEAQNGNIDARNKLIEISIPQIRRCIRNQENFEDIFQDTIVRVIKYLNSFDVDKGNFNHWVSVLTKNYVRRLYIERNKNKEKAFSLFSTEEPSEMFEKYLSVEMKEIDKDQTINKIDSIVETLPNKQKITFNLFYKEGLCHEEISEYLNIHEGTSKSNLSRAKEQIIKQLNK